jgi:hypothetical protein
VTNVDRSAAGTLHLAASDGLRVEPKEVLLRSMTAGEEMEIEVRVSGAPSSANRLGHLRVDGEGGLKTNPAVLTVAHGVCARRDMRRPADFSETIYSPRYIAKAYYMESGATSLLLDPLGYRRSDSSGASYPQLVRYGTDDRGREGWHAENIRKFPYFVPVMIPAKGGKPAYVYEAGWHAHGSRSAVEHRFTENWIVVRFREAQPGERIAFSWLPESRKAEPRGFGRRRLQI